MKRSFIPKNFRPNVPGSKLQVNPNEETMGSFSVFPEEKCIVLLSAKEDIVPDYFLNEIENKTFIVQLYYDELGLMWDFSYTDGDLKLYTKEKTLVPHSIYHRHPGVGLDHPFYQKHIAFFEILDVWNGNLLGQRRDHYQNFSKAYQGVTSIKIASLKTGLGAQYPRSYFLKGSYDSIDEKFRKDLIVKSCSNARSKVVSNEEFFKWDFSNLSNLPTLFQEKLEGNDVRVHVCGNTIWTLEVLSKDCVDYRYASKGTVEYKKIDLPQEIESFCKMIAKTERNKFIGLDFIKKGNSYYCLESNPGPGWSTYHHRTKKKFAQSIFKKLLRS